MTGHAKVSNAVQPWERISMVAKGSAVRHEWCIEAKNHYSIEVKVAKSMDRISMQWSNSGAGRQGYDIAIA